MQLIYNKYTLMHIEIYMYTETLLFKKKKESLRVREGAKSQRPGSKHLIPVTICRIWLHSVSWELGWNSIEKKKLNWKKFKNFLKKKIKLYSQGIWRKTGYKFKREVSCSSLGSRKYTPQKRQHQTKIQINDNAIFLEMKENEAKVIPQSQHSEVDTAMV